MSAGGATLAPWEEAQQSSAPPWEEAARAAPVAPAPQQWGANEPLSREDSARFKGPAYVAQEDARSASAPSSPTSAPRPLNPQPAQLPNGEAQAAPQPGILDRARQSVANSVIGRSLESTVPGVASALHLEPTETENEQQRTGDQTQLPQLPAWANKPLPAPGATTPIQKATEQEIGQFRAQHPVIGGVEKGVEQTAEGLRSPANLALLAAAPEAKPLMALFAAQATQGSYESAEQAYQAFRLGNNAEAAQYATQSGLNAVVAALAGRSALHGASPVDTGRPQVSEPKVQLPQEPRQLTAGPQPEYAGEPPSPPQPAGVVDAEVTPWEEAQRAQLASKAGPTNDRTTPPPVNAGSARTRVAPTQFSPQPQPPPDQGVLVDGQGNAIVNRPALPQPGETAGKTKPIIPAPAKTAASPTQTAPSLAPQMASQAAFVRRPVVQASNVPEDIRQSATEQQPALEKAVENVARAVPGAELEGSRVKDAPSIENKEDRGKPVETTTDVLGARVSAPPDSMPALEAKIERELPVVSKDKIDNNGLEATQYGIKTGKPGEPNQVSELQVVTPQQADVMKSTDDLYDKQKEAEARGDKAEAKRLGEQIAEKFQAVLAKPFVPSKGARIQLQDGRPGTVNYFEPNRQLSRVTLDDGTKMPMVPTRALKPEVAQPSAQKSEAVTPQVAQNGNQPSESGQLEPIGKPIPTRVEQIKQEVAKGTKVVIYTARANDPQVKPYLDSIGLGGLTVTDVKGPDVGWILDDHANVKPNSDTPFDIPKIPAGKALYVDLDKTLAYGPGEKTDAIEPRSSEPAGPHDEAEGSGNVPQEKAAASEPAAKPSDEPKPAATAELAPKEESPVGKQGDGEKPEEVTKFKFGNTQADIPRDSEAAKALVAAQRAIDPADLVKDVNGADGGLEATPHVTVRYGIKGDDTAGIRAYLEKQAPFEATLGKTQAFPPSEHSDGAAPIIAPVESADLRRMEAELDKHGDFNERSFPDYKPHATVAYVKAGEAKRYTGMTETEGKKFTVSSVSISKKDGSTESVALKGGTAAPVKTEADAVAPGTAEPTAHEHKVQELDQLNKSVERISKEMQASGTKDFRSLRKLGNERDRMKGKIEALKREIANDEREAEKLAKRQAIPLTTPEEKIVTDPDKNKWKYQGEYFVKALEPVKEAWLAKFPGADKDPAGWWKFALKMDHPEKLRPAKFPDEFIRIEVPNDGKFLVSNTPAAIDKLLKSAPSAFAKPSETVPGSSKRSIPRAPKDLDPEKLVAYHKAEIEETEQDLKRARPEDREFLQEKLGAARQNLAEAQKSEHRAGTPSETPGAGSNEAGSARSSESQSAELNPRSHQEAVDRSDAENAERAGHSIISMGNRPALLISDDAMVLMDKMRRVKNYSNALTIGPGRIKEFSTALREKASFDPEKRKGLAALADAIEANTTKAGNVIFVRDGMPEERRVSALAEEVFHDWQMENGLNVVIKLLGMGSQMRLAEPALWDKAAKVLLSDYAYKPLALPLEIPAWIASGEYGTLGLTKEEGARLLSRYLYRAAEMSAGKLTPAPPIHPTLRDGVPNAERTGSERETGPNPQRWAGGRDDPQAGDRPKESGGGLLPRDEDAQSASREKRSNIGATLHSGFLDPELFKTLFPDTAARFKDWITDAETPGGDQRALMRETRGERDRMLAMVAKKLESSQRSWIFRSREDSKAFFNAVEGGDLSSLKPKDQALAKAFRGGFDALRKDLQDLNPNILADYIENYFPHIWQRPSMAAQTVRSVLQGKRPFAGKGSFLKQRTIPTIRDGLDMGLTPVSWNPVDLFLRKYSEMSQFLMAQKTLQMMKEAGTVKMVRIGEKPPEGWSRLDDRIGQVHSYDDEGHLYIRANYFAPPDAAKVFNNYVSRGLAGRSGLYDILRWANNNLNSLQLGISAFHASTTAINAATSEVALGIQQLSEGKPIKALGHLISGGAVAPSVIRTMVNGSRMMKEYLSPGSYKKMAAEASAIAEAGGRAKMDVIQLSALDKTINAFRNGAVGEGLLSIPGTILQTTISPVMDYMVPRMKLGAFYDMAHDVFDQAGKHNWSEEQIRSKMQRAWDSIDNRFGQLVYDNLFWHKALQDTLMLASRSVGWNFGDLRELGGAAADVGKQAGRAASGKMPEVTPRMAFAFALPLVTGLVGAALTYLWTGQKPDTWKDYFYPKRKDGTRVSIPGYMKDVVAIRAHPFDTIVNKMSPLFEATAEAIDNRDFYGTEIRHKDDAPVKQFIEVAKWAGEQMKPFSFSGTEKLLKNEGEDTSTVGATLKSAAKHAGDLALGQLGFQPAPAYIQNSPALNKAREYGQDNRPSGTRTQEQTDHQNAMHAIEDMYHRGDVHKETIEALKKSGAVSEQDVIKAKFYARTDPLTRAVRSLSPEQALNVYKLADDKEKKILRPTIEAKSREVNKVTDSDQRNALKKAFHDTLNPQPQFRGKTA